MEIRHLRYFVEIVRHKSFTGAASALYTTQPALTKAIKSLEEELGVSLIERSKRILQLTEAGELFFARSGEILEKFDDLSRIVRDTPERISGVVNVGTMAVATAFFTALSAHFSEKYPDVILNIQQMTSQEVLSGILARKVDIGFVALSSDRPDDELIESRLISHERVVAMVSRANPLAGRSVVTACDLRGENLVFFSDNYRPHQMISDLCLQRDFHPKVVGTAPYSHLLVRMVTDHQGVSFLPESYANEYLTSSVVMIPFEPVVLRDVHIVHRRDRYLSKAVLKALDFAADYFENRGNTFIRGKL